MVDEKKGKKRGKVGVALPTERDLDMYILGRDETLKRMFEIMLQSIKERRGDHVEKADTWAIVYDNHEWIKYKINEEIKNG